MPLFFPGDPYGKHKDCAAGVVPADAVAEWSQP